MPAVRDSKTKPKAKPQAGPRKAAKAAESRKIVKAAIPPKKSAGQAPRASTKAIGNGNGTSAKAIGKAVAKSVIAKAPSKPALNGAKPVAKGAPILVRSTAKIPAKVTKPSHLPERPNLARGMGANGIMAGKMGKNGVAAVMANGKPTLAKPKNGSSKPKREIVLPPDYVPSEGEPFMNAMHRVYFKQKLLAWKEEILRQNMETLKGLHDESAQQADPADRATAETDRALELRARDRQRKLMGKIDAALARIEEGSYGYCEETGEPINLKRLDARPIATLSLEAQERRERRERVFRED